MHVTSINQFDPFPMLTNYRYDMITGTAPCLFDTHASLTQAGGGMGDEGDALFYGDCGILFEPAAAAGKLGLESSLLSLESHHSRSVELEEGNIPANNRNNIDMKSNNNNNIACFNNTGQSFKVHGDKILGLENHHWPELEENLRMQGDQWDLEGLMDNISSFPNFLDFQLE